jgi:hypothetical protein
VDLFDAVKAGNIQVVQQILRRVGGADRRDEEGNTPLHFAETEEMARVLLQFGGRANVRNILGQTPLHRWTNELHALLLLQCGALPYQPDHSGRQAHEQLAVAAALRSRGGRAYTRRQPAAAIPVFSPMRVAASFGDALGIVPGALTEEDLDGAWQGVSAAGVAS